MNYYPLVRGKQFDLLALVDALQDGLAPQIIPVIEPVKDNPQLPAVVKAFAAASHPLFVLQNPLVGAYGLLAQPRHPVPVPLPAPVQPARYFDAQPAPLLIVRTMAEAQALPAAQWVILPAEARYRALRRPHAIYLQDTFPVRDHTADYYTLQTERYQYPLASLPGAGFADYPLATQHYFEHGYPSRAIAVHLLVPDHGGLALQHFVSVNNDDFSDPAGKFFEALAPIPHWLAGHPTADTPALQDLLALATAHHFPGLGKVRELELRHFYTVMGHFLAGN